MRRELNTKEINELQGKDIPYSKFHWIHENIDYKKLHQDCMDENLLPTTITFHSGLCVRFNVLPPLKRKRILLLNKN